MPKQEEHATGMEGVRGRPEHHVRDQIVVAAKAHFSHYGYDKTTVADLARAIGFSKAYIYKFFESKVAIGEAICSFVLKSIEDAAERALESADSPTEKLRLLFKVLSTESANLFFQDRKLYDIAAFSAEEDWKSFIVFKQRVHDHLHAIVLEGRQSREFERKTPIDEVVKAISVVMSPFVNPLLLQYNLDGLDEAVSEVSNLVLRSLAP